MHLGLRAIDGECGAESCDRLSMATDPCCDSAAPRFASAAKSLRIKPKQLRPLLYRSIDLAADRVRQTQEVACLGIPGVAGQDLTAEDGGLTVLPLRSMPLGPAAGASHYWTPPSRVCRD